MHPFTPIPLFFCAKFLLSCTDLDAALQTQSQALFETINQLCPVNKLARTCLMKLNLSLEGES